LYKILLQILLYAFILIPKVYSQFYPGTFGIDQQGCTDNSQKIDGIGIGDFLSNFDVPHAALDVHVPYLNDQGSQVGQGNAFSTYADSMYLHSWQMFSYPNILKGYLANPSWGLYQNNFMISAVRGHLDFRAADVHYMRLHANGNLGIADCFGPGGVCGNFAAQSLLHLNQHNDTASVWMQITNGNTGFSTANMGLSIGIEPNSGYNGAGTANSFAKLIQHADAPMKFYTNDTDRVIINSRYNPTIHLSTVNTNGYVGIGENLYWDEEAGGEGPRSLLHLQGPNTSGYNGMGWRTWNKTGIYISEQSDQIYLGLKDESAINGSNRSDAVIVWGDDRLSSGDHYADNFRLIFNGSSYGAGNGGTNPRDPKTINGLETMRMTPFGLMGVGPLFTWSLPPVRRLELLDLQDPTDSSSLNEPQLRLSYKRAASGFVTTTGKWTDFQSTSNGDLYINPKDSATNRRVGINTATPITTLQVGGSAGSSGAITSDFLNHSFAPSLPSTNPWIAYSDTNGTIKHLPRSTDPTYVLHGDGSWGAGGNGNVSIGCGIPTTNYIPKFNSTVTTICNSQIYDDGINVGINDFSPPEKLSIQGNLRLDHDSDAFYLVGDRFLASDGNGWINNIYLGIGAGPVFKHNNTGYGDICIGTGTGQTLHHLESFNVLIGQSAGFSLQENHIGSASSNVCIGTLSGTNLDTANLNTMVGHYAGLYFTEGNGNVVIGGNSGTSGGDGSDNVLVGHDAETDGTTNIDSSCAIGVSAYALGNRSVALGEMSRAQANDVIVMGTTPTRTLMGYTSAPGGLDSTARLYVSAISSGRSAYFSGSISTTGVVYHASDMNLKNNIQPLLDASNIIDQLQPKTYNFDVQSHPELNLPNGQQYGLISQQVENVLPSLVETEYNPAILDTAGNIITPASSFKGLNYTGLIPILIKGLQEQKARIDQLEAEIQNCCAAGSTQRTSNPAIKVELSNSIILNQNDPNPFAEETKISFNIPGSVNSAKIIFFDNNGKIIQTVVLNERGSGQLNVFASNLTSGLYSYSLICDGKVIDTKKMVISK
jgi:hypothetical protein